MRPRETPPKLSLTLDKAYMAGNMKLPIIHRIMPQHTPDHHWHHLFLRCSMPAAFTALPKLNDKATKPSKQNRKTRTSI